MANVAWESILNDKSSVIKNEVETILEAFCRWMKEYQKIESYDISYQDLLSRKELRKISTQTALNVSEKSINMLMQTTSEGRPNYIFLYTLLIMKGLKDM